MKIRFEHVQDHDAIADVTARAFAGVEHSDQTEPAIVAALRAAGALSLSLVAVEREEVIGHIAFSRVTIEGKHEDWFGLGPVSVCSEHQGAGIGASLIRQGLDCLRSSGAAGCVVVGEPAYYRRFGFENDPALFYEGVPPDYFMRLSFGASNPSGRVDYHPAFAVH